MHISFTSFLFSAKSFNVVMFIFSPPHLYVFFSSSSTEFLRNLYIAVHLAAAAAGRGGGGLMTFIPHFTLLFFVVILVLFLSFMSSTRISLCGNMF